MFSRETAVPIYVLLDNADPPTPTSDCAGVAWIDTDTSTVLVNFNDDARVDVEYTIAEDGFYYPYDSPYPKDRCLLVDREFRYFGPGILNNDEIQVYIERNRPK